VIYMLRLKKKTKQYIKFIIGSMIGTTVSIVAMFSLFIGLLILTESMIVTILLLAIMMLLFSFFCLNRLIEWIEKQ